MKKIAIVIGGRPQIIKAFPLVKALRKNKVKFILINSGQHYSKELFDNQMSRLHMPTPDYNLNIGPGTQAKQIGRIMQKIEPVLINEKPRALILFGDMNTTLASALTASKLNIPIIHIEAGIRSRQKKMSEENNRILVDHLSTILIAPNKEAIQNLCNENIKNNPESSSSPSVNEPMIINGGDIMQESLHLARSLADDAKILKKYQLKPKTYALTTIHRAENTQDADQLQNVIKFVVRNAANLGVIFPIHPKTKKLIRQNKINPGRLKMIKPLDYIEMSALLANANVVFTDSGGLQKEACWLNIPCIILRNETEWPDLINSKQAVLYKQFDENFTFSKNHTKQDMATSEELIKALKKI